MDKDKTTKRNFLLLAATLVALLVLSGLLVNMFIS